MKEYSFNNLQELDTFLKSIDISVPLRSEGRKTEHTERYSIVNFLSQSKNDLFNDFPIKLIHSDKPDFRILSESISIGIEVTELIPEQLARAASLLEIHFSNDGELESEFFGWDAPQRTNDEILEILNKSNERLIGTSYGKIVEERWMQGIYGCINNKIRKLNNDNFEKLTENWLLIYDNQIRVSLDKEYLINKFPLIMNNYLNNVTNYVFDRIIVESGNYFYFINFKKDTFIEVAPKNVG